MLSMVLVAQLAIAVPDCASRGLCAILGHAEATRRIAIAAMRSMEATAESDIVLLERTGDSVRPIQIEQIRSRVRWRAPDRLEQHIVAHRAGLLRTGVSTLTLMRHPWVIASPGGGQLRDALRMPLGIASASAVALHPLDPGRDSVYMITGGDTAQVTLPGGETVTVHRAYVAPRSEMVTTPALAFRGLLELEAATGALVRMRGDVVQLAPRPSYWRRVVARAVQTVLVVDLTYAPSRTGHWVPVLQRVDLRATSPAVGGVGMVLRVTTRLVDHRVNRRRTRACGSVVDDGPAMCLTTKRHATADTASWPVPLAEVEAAIGRAASDPLASISPPANGHDRAPDTSSPGAAGDGAWVDRWRDRFDAMSSRVRVPGMHLGAEVRRAWTDGALHGAVAARWRDERWHATVGIERELIGGTGLLPMPGANDGSVVIHGGTRHSIPTHTSFARTFGVSRTVRLAGAFGAADGSSASGMPCIVRFGGSNPTAAAGNLRAVAALTIGSRVSESYGARGGGAGLRVERMDCRSSARHWNGFVAARGARAPVSWSGRFDVATATRASLSTGLAAFETPLVHEHGPGAPFVRRHAARVRLAGALDLGTLPTPMRMVAGLWVASDRPSIVGTIESGWREHHAWQRGRWLRHESLDTRVEVTLRPFGGDFGIGVARSITGNPRWGVVMVSEPAW